MDLPAVPNGLTPGSMVARMIRSTIPDTGPLLARRPRTIPGNVRGRDRSRGEFPKTARIRPTRGCRRVFAFPILLLLIALGVTGCGRDPAEVVVVYTALDRAFSEPVFERFTAETGIEVRARYDAESTKTVGLANRLRHEASRPVCDVYWNNEPLHTIRLAEEGVLIRTSVKNTEGIPSRWRDPSLRWVGFSARARVLLVNTDRLSPTDYPRSVLDLAAPRFRGRAAIAKPLFGTTASHIAVWLTHWGPGRTSKWLGALKENDVQIHGGNRPCAEAVSSGHADFGLTDTDDAIGEIRAGAPVKIIYPDQEAGGLGTLYLPNTASMVQGAPHPNAAKRLLEFLVTAEVEALLAASGSAQIPLRPGVAGPEGVSGPGAIEDDATDLIEAASNLEAAKLLVTRVLLSP